MARGNIHIEHPTSNIFVLFVRREDFPGARTSVRFTFRRSTALKWLNQLSFAR
jgi:hypothetical protein